MCFELIRYNVCKHERRRFLKGCKFVRNAGCFEPICAYFFGERNPTPCQFPKVAGKAHTVEGWCSELCRARNEDPGNHSFMGGTLGTYRLGQGAAVGEQEVNGHCVPPLKTQLYRHEQVYSEMDDEVSGPQGVPLGWPFRNPGSRGQTIPGLGASPQPVHTPSQQTQDGDDDRPTGYNRWNQDFARPESEPSQAVPTSRSSRQGRHSPLRGTSDMSEPGRPENSSMVTRPLSRMYRSIPDHP